MTEPVPYIPGSPPHKLGPLARYLPPLPDGVGEAWLRARVEPGSWVLDPFGAAPRLAVEAARAGYRVLVAANNPVARFLLEMEAHPPSAKDLQAALAELAATYKGEERMEPHIKGLYETRCKACGATVSAQAFIWERGAEGPFAKIYRCPECGDSGEHPATEADREKAARFSRVGLHHARALARVAPPEDPDRAHAEEALSTYLPRAVYALITLINKLDGRSGASPGLLRNIRALLLAACDRANTLWPYPNPRARPRQLTVPPRFFEHNIWLAMEEALELWPTREVSEPLQVTVWPELPPEKGLCLFEGRLKGFRQAEGGLRPAAVCSGLPRPNQAYWSLSALWAGWLWGTEAAAPFKPVLRRRRYDWAWHTTALLSAFENLEDLLDPETPYLGLIGETEPGFLSAALLAGQAGGFVLRGLALRSETGQSQIHWAASPEAGEPGSQTRESLEVVKIRNLAREAGKDHLLERGEPADYILLHAAALDRLVHAEEISLDTDLSPAETYTQVTQAFQDAFSYRGGFLRFGGSEHSLEVGRWWLRDDEQAEPPLSDRVEMETVRFLIRHPGSTLGEVDAALCERFPGLLTPDPGLLLVCLQSYGEQDPPESGRWRMRAGDRPARRHNDLRTMQQHLLEIGQRLGYLATSEGVRQVIWREGSGPVIYSFHLVASAVIGDLVLASQDGSQRPVLVYPNSRANLTAYKMRTDSRLRQAIQDRWRLLKFRHLRNLAENPNLTRENFEELLALDPMEHTGPQMPLL